MDISKIIEKKVEFHSDFSVSEDELLEFVKEYMLVKYLKEKYKKSTVNRKELGQDILEKVNILNSMISRFKTELRINKDNYKYSEYITDGKLILDLLLYLANKNIPRYTLKTFNIEQNTSYDDRELVIKEREVHVISNRDVLDQMKETKITNLKQFQDQISKIVFKGNSAVILTNYSYDWHILPRNDNIPKANIKSFRVNGFTSDLCCYTYNDMLGSAVDKLDYYIEQYGGNLDNISLDVLIERISKLDNKQKTKSL